jgi:ABC-type transport system involved in cytochrome bd biosynthesis fused ATPase/permease subunit
MTGGYSTLQELFDGSLIENIHMGIEGVTLDRVLEIISAVGLDAFVRGEKDGLEMRLQLGGGNLPETIYRKIILARSLATHPSLLLLNDPFEGLSEDDVQGFLSYVQKWMPGATVILATKSRESRSFISQTYSVKEQHLLSYSPENN